MKHLGNVLRISAIALFCGCGGGSAPTPDPVPGPPPPRGQAYTALHTFRGGGGGKNPTAGLIRDASGNLYGTAACGGDLACPDGFGGGCGTVFKLDSGGGLTTLHAFAGGPKDGAFPQEGLIRDTSGNFYGTTGGGGNRSCVQGCGTVFKLDAAGSETVLYKFTGGADGLLPNGRLLREAAGNLYGTTVGGGSSCRQGCGTVFKVDPRGAFTTLHVFASGSRDGAIPNSGLVQDADGNLYGTSGGGKHQNGTVFKLDATGTESVLYHFTGAADGASPRGVITDETGNLYGTTEFGGNLDCSNDFSPSGCGTLFKLDPGGTLTTLHVFGRSGQPRTDLSFPSPDLIRDAAGNLYGTSGGGAHERGAVFKLHSNGDVTLIYSFTGVAEGIDRRLGIMDSAGHLYGTAFGGGDTTCDPTNGGCGLVFEIKAA